ncbi:MAG: chemotaxis protein CheA [Deltaproteobacteria bacterium]|nr:chemotaxis protein CheA [Deltaproteobacteria bacterium]
MSMDALTATAFSALAKRDLPALHGKLVALAKLPPQKRAKDPDLASLIDTAMASLRALSAWAKDEPTSVPPPIEIPSQIPVVTTSSTSPELSLDDDIKRDFLANADDMMQQIATGLLDLERVELNRDSLDRIFRAAHNLKGAAGMLGLQVIGQLTHALESQFDRLRRGEVRPDSKLIDQLLHDLDQVRSEIQTMKNPPIHTLPSGDSRLPSSATETEENGTIRVDLQRLDKLVNLVGELVIDRTRFAAIEDDLRSSELKSRLGSKMSETLQLFGRHMSEIHDTVMKIRMVPISNALTNMPRVVRDLSRQLGKGLTLELAGEQTELDKTIVEAIADPLLHIVRNACDHGIESKSERLALGKREVGHISIKAKQEGNQIVITVRDDGRGLNADMIRRKAIERGMIAPDSNLSRKDLFNIIFESGFSTASQVTELSGRGVGMDVVRRQVARLKGVIDIDSEVGQGTAIEIRLPLTLSILQSLLVEAQGQVFAIPLSSVIESLRITPDDIQVIGDQEVIKWHDRVLPLLHLHKAMGLEYRDEISWYSQAPQIDASAKLKALRIARRKDRLYVVIIGTGERRIGIVCDQLLNQQEMVIKSLGPILQNVACVAGGAVLGHGEVVLVLDIPELASTFRSPLRRLSA